MLKQLILNIFIIMLKHANANSIDFNWTLNCPFFSMSSCNNSIVIWHEMILATDHGDSSAALWHLMMFFKSM